MHHVAVLGLLPLVTRPILLGWSARRQSPATRMKSGFHTSFGTVETAGQDCSLIYDMFVFANLYLSVLFTVLCQFSASYVRLLSKTLGVITLRIAQ